VLEGGCLCGRVRYQVDSLDDDVSHCHCSMCRKAHGAAFGTYAAVKPGGFRWLQGETLVKEYASTPQVTRTFGGHCGTTLQFIVEGETRKIDVALGTLDGDPGIRPRYHIFTDSKAPWFEITDNLPQYKTRP